MTKRIENDAYQTPADCVSKILAYVDLTNINRFLEPCRGAGNIYYRVHAETKVYCEITEGRDYLNTHFKETFDLIITNPPFSLWREFLEKSLTEAGTVIYLLRLNILGSGIKTKRGKFWNANRPTHLFPLERRPSFTNGGNDSCDYAWFCWDRGNRIKTNNWLTVL